MNIDQSMLAPCQSYRQDPDISFDEDNDNRVSMIEENKIPMIVGLYSDYQINKNVLLKFSIQNLMNKNYSEALSRMNSSTMMRDQDERTQTARGRTYVMGAEVRF
ncbi:TonB-dependent receptor [Xenorhabdus bovienii]|uniref:TonB-dependent receptor n=1 Tax=Xenorhabdus bovienii TaxID=40576 RepID=UPI00237CA26A|nr:TonB-dependent receptor [Xenorhabdus bovienii]MDE1488765.1 TonB-dependent receptor [Xenorhabdus bovienii]MDE9479622.1 TonB-dependent receptor [Xenorhabdus bovienii]MDE9532549.1 TonB-dependent receptor [Xenorhabdus bovienii]